MFYTFYLRIMPRKAKKTSGPKNGTRKNNKKEQDLDGSMTQAIQGDTVCNSLFEGNILPTSAASSDASVSHVPSSVPSDQAPTSQATPIDKSDAILAYLERLDPSNQALTKCVAKLETNRSMASTPLNARTRPILHPSVPNPTHSTVPAQHLEDRDGTAIAPTHSFNPVNPLLQPSAGNISSHMGANQFSHQGRPQFEASAIQAQSASDGIVPSLSTLTQNQEISHTVNQVLSSY